MLYHAWYQMVLGAVAASEHAASEGASGMGEAFRYVDLGILHISPNKCPEILTLEPSKVDIFGSELELSWSIPRQTMNKLELSKYWRLLDKQLAVAQLA